MGCKRRKFLRVKEFHFKAAILSANSVSMNCRKPILELIQDNDESDACMKMNEIRWKIEENYCVTELHETVDILSANLETVSCKMLNF